MAKCRICLCSKPRKDVSELNITQNGETQNYKHVMMFCLGIQITDDPITNTRLCVKCYKKVIEFYDFKVLAMKNDETMRVIFTSVSEHEDGIYSSNKDIKQEVDWGDSCDNDIGEELLELSKHEIRHCSANTPMICIINDTDDMKDQDHTMGVNDIDNVKFELKEEESENEVLSVIKHLKDEDQVDIPEIGTSREIIKLKNVTVALKKMDDKRLKLDVGKEKKRKTSTICDECGKSVKDLAAHKRHHKNKDQQFKCDYCDKVYKKNIYKRKHVQRKHLSAKQKCNLCGRTVLDLKTHTQVMHMKNTLKFECVHCKKKFLTQARLNGHISVHTKDRPFECEICGACFRLKLLLNSHRRQVHDKEKSHACHLCPKRFFKKDHLRIHIRSHTNERPYECPDCGKRLQSATILKNHRLRHGATKNCKCTLCDATFYTKSNLYNHMMSHMKQKRHLCRFCDARFHRSDHRNRHERTAHIKYGAQLPSGDDNDGGETPSITT